jgi:hypothetical protein
MANRLMMRKMLFVITIGSLISIGLKVPLAHALGLGGICWASVVGIGAASISGVIVIRSTLRFQQSRAERVGGARKIGKAI